MNEKLIDCLTGVPSDDVPALCEMLKQIAKAVNPNLTDEAYLTAFGDFWATCFAFPGEPPVKGMQFMQAVLHAATWRSSTASMRRSILSLLLPPSQLPGSIISKPHPRPKLERETPR